jgi:membrane associated rhomboid family serine protease
MVTRILIILNVLAFVWEAAALGSGIISGNVSTQGLYQVGGLVPAAVTQDHEYWRLVTAAFLHLNLLHIGVNMFSLWILGRIIESAIGSPRMALIYMISMLASSLGVVYFSGPLELTVGASGAIYGLFGALFAIGFKFGKPGMELIRANLGILVINLIFTFAVPGISKAGHIGGLLAGFIATFLIYFPPRRVYANVVDASTGAQIDAEIESPDQPRSPYA